MTTLTLKGFATATRRNIRARLHRRKLANGHCGLAVMVRKHKPFTFELRKSVA